MQVSSRRWVSVFKGGRLIVQLTLGARPRQFFSFFFPLRRVLSLFFFHQDAFRCFPFIIFLNINAPIIIIRIPTLFLCSFHNNDNKCFVGYVCKLKKENARTPRALDIAEIYIFLFVESSCALVSGNTNKSLRTKEGRKEGLTD